VFHFTVEINLQTKSAIGGILHKGHAYDSQNPWQVPYSDGSSFYPKAELLLCHDGVQKTHCSIKNFQIFFDVSGTYQNLLDLNSGIFGIIIHVS